MGGLVCAWGLEKKKKRSQKEQNTVPLSYPCISSFFLSFFFPFLISFFSSTFPFSFF